MSDIQTTLKKAKGNKKLIFIPIILIALVLVLVAYKIVFADSAKLVFFTAIDNEMKKISSEEKDGVDSVLNELLEAISQRSNVNDTIITGNISVTKNGMEIAEISQIAETIGNLSLNIHNESDVDNKINYSQIYLKSNENNIFDLIYYLDKEKHILGSSILHEKLFSVKLSEMDIVLEKLGLVSSMSSEEITSAEIKEALSFDSEEYKEKMTEYKDFIIEYFDKEEFVKNDSIVMVSDKSVDCSEIILETTGEKMNAFLLEAVQKFDVDEELKFLMADSIENIFKLLKDKGYEEIITIGMENEMMTMDDEKFHFPDRWEIKGGIENASEYIIQFLQKIKFIDGFRISLYVDNKNNIIKYEVECIVEVEGDQISFEIESENYKTSDEYSEKSFSLYIEPKSENITGENYLKFDVELLGTPQNDNEIIYEANGKVELLTNSQKMFDADLVFRATVQETENSKTINVEKGTLQIKTIKYSDEEMDDALLIYINNFTTLQQSSKTKERNSVEFDFGISTSYGFDLNLNGDIDDIVIRKDNVDAYERSIGLDLTGTMINEGVEFKLDLGIIIEEDFDFDKEPSIPVFNDTDYIDVGGLDDYELEELKNEIMGNIFALVFGGIGGLPIQ